MVEGYMKTLVTYIKKNLSKGYTVDSLKWSLISQGYSRTEVDRAIKLTNEELAKSAPKIKEKPIIKFQREAISGERRQALERGKGFLGKLRDFFED